LHQNLNRGKILHQNLILGKILHQNFHSKFIENNQSELIGFSYRNDLIPYLLMNMKLLMLQSELSYKMFIKTMYISRL